MQRIQTGADFHLFHFVYRLTCCEHNTAFFQCRSSVREIILDYQILCFLSIYKRSNISIFGCDNRFQFFHTVIFQHLLNRSIRTWSNLINHTPWERYLSRLFNISFKSCFCLTVGNPFLSKCCDGCFQLVTIMGAVICADHSDRFFTCLITGVQKRSHFTDITLWLCRSLYEIRCDIRNDFSFTIYKAVTFFCNGKCTHLQRIFCKNFFQTTILCLILRIQNTGLYYTADNCFFNSSICFQSSKNGVVIMWPVHFFNDFIIETFHYNDTAIQHTFIQKVLSNICLECTENISSTEMNPERIFICCSFYFFTIKFWQRISFGFPLGSVCKTLFI